MCVSAHGGLGDAEDFGYFFLAEVVVLMQLLCEQRLYGWYDGFYCDFAWNYQGGCSPVELVARERYISMSYVIYFMTYVMSGCKLPDRF